MKKIVSVIILAVMLLSVLGIAVSAAANETAVHVTVYDGKSVVVANEKVAIEAGKTDDLNSVFKAINEKHGKKYETATGDYGAYITCLWDVENGGAYGYYVNDQMSMGLTDTVKAGDHVYVFVYSDATYYTDTYSYFDAKDITVKKGKEVTLTLKHIGYDESWNTVSLPVAGATITLDGKALDAKTDENGKVTIKLTKSGVISATSEDLLLVPPVAVATVQSALSTSTIVIIVCIAVIVAAVVVIIVIRKKK